MGRSGNVVNPEPGQGTYIYLLRSCKLKQKETSDFHDSVSIDPVKMSQQK